MNLWLHRICRRRMRGGRLTLATQQGKRYKCAKCGTEVMVTKAGNGTLKCCGEEMQPKK